MRIEPKKYHLERHDLSVDKSLRAWSAADEYLLQRFEEFEGQANHLCIYNDRFGYLACHLHSFDPTLIVTQKSQEKAMDLNLNANGLGPINYSTPIASLEKEMELALIKIPKSLDLFRLFLEQIIHNSTKEIVVIAAFMTRHFSPKLLQIAEEYFEVVEQSRALKKARLLLLTKKKATHPNDIINLINYKGQSFQQYLGVFSAGHIDYATQFFLAHLEMDKKEQMVLDLASGNGIIGHQISQQIPTADIHLMDDSFLAVESAKLNIQGPNIHHHFNNDLANFDDASFDLIVTNPPFHFEHEINIQIPLQLFKACFRCLKKGGNLQLVANKHLNYKVHLARLFLSVDTIAENEKFVVYKCVR